MTGFESIQEGLLKSGYDFEETTMTFTKEQTSKRVMQINDQQVVQEIKHQVTIQYLGTGEMADADGSNKEDLHGFAISVNDEDIDEVYVRDWDDFVSLTQR